jgi:hypothetical protein
MKYDVDPLSGGRLTARLGQELFRDSPSKFRRPKETSPKNVSRKVPHQFRCICKNNMVAQRDELTILSICSCRSALLTFSTKHRYTFRGIPSSLPTPKRHSAFDLQLDNK